MAFAPIRTMVSVSKKQNQNERRSSAERVLKMNVDVRGDIGQSVRAASDSGRVPVFALISCKVSE